VEDLKSKLNQTLFWDVNFEKLDIDKYWPSVVVRILEYGDWEQWQAARRYYGDKKIIEAVTSVKWLTEKAWIFCSAVYNIPKENFKCYTTRLSSPVPWL
jgi:hypothetical protein